MTQTADPTKTMMTTLSNLDGRSLPERKAKLRRKKAHKRNQRPAEPHSIRFTKNDLEVVVHVNNFGILSQRQLERLTGKSRGTMQARLMRLYHHLILDRLYLRVEMGLGSPALYVLGSRGVELLKTHFGVSELSGRRISDPKDFFLQHILAINEFRILVQLACQVQGWQLIRWQDDYQLKRSYDKVAIQIAGRKSTEVAVQPDAYFTIEVPERGVSHFFLELDRNTETLDRVKTKYAAYTAYYKSGQYENRFSAKSFRVLTVVSVGEYPKHSEHDVASESTRLQSLMRAAETLPGIGRRLWFGSLVQLSQANLLHDGVWHIAGQVEPQSLFNL